MGVGGRRGLQQSSPDGWLKGGLGEESVWLELLRGI